MHDSEIYPEDDFSARVESTGDGETRVFVVGNGESAKVLYDKRVVPLWTLEALLGNGHPVSRVVALPDGAYSIGTAYCFCPICLHEMRLSDMRVVSKKDRASYSAVARAHSLSAAAEDVLDYSLGRNASLRLNPEATLARVHDTCGSGNALWPWLQLAFDEILDDSPSGGERIVADVAEIVEDGLAFARCPLCGRAFSLEWREGEIFRKQLSVCKRGGVIELKIESSEGILETGVRLDFDRATAFVCRLDGKWRMCNTPETFAQLPRSAGCSFDAVSHIRNLLGNVSDKAACSGMPKGEVSPLRLALMARFQGYDEGFYASACSLLSRESPQAAASVLLRLPHRFSEDKLSSIEELAEEAGFPNTKRFRRIAFTKPIVCAIGAHVGGLRVDNPDRLAALVSTKGFPILAFALWGGSATMSAVSDAAIEGFGESSFARWACSENALAELEILAGSVDKAVDDGYYVGPHIDDAAAWMRDNNSAMDGGFAGFVRRSPTYVPMLLSLSAMGMEKYVEPFDYGDEIERALCIGVDGLVFRPVVSPKELVQSALEMHNCLAGYVEKAACERYIVIAKDGDKRIVAALELDAGFDFVQGFQPLNVPIAPKSALGKAVCRYVELVGGRMPLASWYG